MKKFLKEYRVELAAVLVGVVGVFLLVERVDLRQNIYAVAKSLLLILKQMVDRLDNYIFHYLRNLTPSDLLGWVLIFGILVVVVWRIRYRFSTSDHWNLVNCPKCGADLHRTHRTALERILAKTLLPEARRYRCNDRKCGWSGLRRRIEPEHLLGLTQDTENPSAE